MPTGSVYAGWLGDTSGIPFTPESWFTKSLPGMVCVIPVVGSFNVAVPSSPTVTSLSGFLSWTFALTFSFSSGVNPWAFFAGTFSVGFTGSKSFGCAVTIVGSDGLLSPFVAVAATRLLSLTPSAGINNVPVPESTVTPAGLSDDDHVPFLALTTVTVFWALFSSI